MNAIGTNAVRKIDIGMFLNIGLDLLPITVVVADFFAGGTDRKQTGKRLDLRQSFGQFLDQL